MIHELNTLRPGYQGRFESTEAHRRELIGLIIVGDRLLGELGYWHESSDIYFSAGTFHRDDCLREFDDAEHRGSPVIFKGPRLRDAQAIADRFFPTGRIVLWVHPEANWGELADPALSEFLPD